MNKQQMLGMVAERIAGCTKCTELTCYRRQTVPGEGNPFAKLVFIGEAPGENEDEQGRPFVGKAGELLTNIIKAMDLNREQVFILNALKCRPPNNRTPNDDELSNCRPFLELQLKVIRPSFICCLGGVAAKSLLGIEAPVGSLRSRIFEYNEIKVTCTYHPSFVIRSKTDAERYERKLAVWDDMQFLLGIMEGKP